MCLCISLGIAMLSGLKSGNGIYADLFHHSRSRYQVAGCGEMCIVSAANYLRTYGAWNIRLFCGGTMGTCAIMMVEGVSLVLSCMLALYANAIMGTHISHSSNCFSSAAFL